MPQSPDTPPVNELIEKDRENAGILQGSETNTQQGYTETAVQSDMNIPMEGADNGGIDLITDDIPTTSIRNTKTNQEGMSKDTTEMAIDDPSVERDVQGDPQPPGRADDRKEGADADEDISRNAVRPKKIRLEAGNERQAEWKRTRLRTSQK
jgi:hypothetical protein